MKPAFSSGRQAAAWALLLATLLALPCLLAKTGWLRRDEVYPSIPARFGPFAWIQQAIYTDAGDVDLAFVGSSKIWNGIDTPYVEKAFSERLGRQARVITLGWPWAGFDEVYFIARDLLDRHHVRTLVVYDDSSNEDMPQTTSFRVFRIGENSEALRGLPLLAQVRLYGGAVLAAPRQLLSVLRPAVGPTVSVASDWTSAFQAPPTAERLGSLRARLSGARSPHFIQLSPAVQASPADALIYGDETRASFKFMGPALAPYQLHFARKLAQLCRDRGTQLVVLHVPTFTERDEAEVRERVLWPDILGRDVKLVGIPPARMFAAMSRTDVEALFYEGVHLNRNGQDVFTPLITPSLLKLYDLSATR
jgi:hypothetical protein